MKKCYKCGTAVKSRTCVKEGVRLHCMRCPKCGEEYFTSSELLKFDILTGRRKLVRKFGVLGESIIVRVPDKILQEYKIKPGDYGVFEKRREGILIKPVHAKQLKYR